MTYSEGARLLTKHLGNVRVLAWARPDDDADTSYLDGDRLAQFENDEFSHIGILAAVDIDGVRVARTSLWGIESDEEESYILSEARQVAMEACFEARLWLQERKNK